MKRRVIVLGGGIGGLSAAHELSERGFEVDVYEASRHLGGKARSQSIAGTGSGGRANLPGEHGFRFFPSFYRHVIDTMGRIPVADTGTVAARLQESERMGMAERSGLFCFARHPPASFDDIAQLTSVIESFFRRTNVSERDMARFSFKMFKFMLACEERREAEYENISFWDFVDGDSYEPKFQKYIKTPRFMVAMDPRHGSARTIGTKALQILVDFVRNGTRTDAVLDGPTSERWIEPWRDHLAAMGVRFHHGRPVTALRLDGKRIGAARVGREWVQGDHYVLALPLDRVQPLITDELASADPDFEGIRRLQHATSWMSGVQFFLKNDPGICRGHIAYPDSAWALSSVSQGQFWRYPISKRYGNGLATDILSVDVSDWETVSPRTGKAARDSTADEVIEEVWSQLVDGLGDRLRREDVVHVHVDENMIFHDGRVENTTPLLVHPPGSWWDRPGAVSGLDNLVFAADYVKTNTDLASMEGANEAARRAVNGILVREGSAVEPCMLWSLEEDMGEFVEAARALDRVRFHAQMPSFGADRRGRPERKPEPSSGVHLRVPSAPDTLDDLQEILEVARTGSRR